MNRFEIPLKTRRNYLQILSSLGKNISSAERKEAMKVGDYIDIPYETFSSWMELPPINTNNNSKSNPGIVRVSIAKIYGDKILIQTGNQQKEINANLFFDYMHE